MTPEDEPRTASVEVTVTHNPFAVFYKLFTPTIDINGMKERRPWGIHRFLLAPGEYKIAVSYPWIIQECGRNSLQLTLAAGETRKVRYSARLIRFLPGSIKVTA